MLYDRGLQTEKQIKEHEDFFSRRFTGQWQGHGCISSRICEKCKHLISDSICLCVGVFTCPNCQFENGQKIKALIEEARKRPYQARFNTNGAVLSYEVRDLEYYI